MNIATLSLPPELLEGLKEIRDTLREKATPLEDSVQGRDVIALVDQIHDTIGTQLRLFSHALGARRYHARIFLYEEEKKGKRLQWELTDVQMAEPEHVSGSIDHLRALMDGMINTPSTEVKGRTGKAIAMWVFAMRGLGEDAYLAYFRHSENFECAFVIRDGGWSSLGLTEEALNLSLHAALKLSSSKKNKWAGLVGAQLTHMKEELQEVVAEFFTDKVGTKLTDELWDDLATLIFTNPTQIRLFQEIGRATGASALQESQRMLETTALNIHRVIDMQKDKVAQMEKSQLRVQKKFKTDLDKLKAAGEVASNHLKQLRRENQALRSQLKKASAGQDKQGNEESIGLALDRFFT